MVPGTIFDQVDRWQKLELVHMLPTIERLARVLRASSRRPVRLDGAYIEKVVVNLLGGPGQSEVFLDDLEISPVPEEVLAAWSKSHVIGEIRCRREGRRTVAAKGAGRSPGSRSPGSQPARKAGKRRPLVRPGSRPRSTPREQTSSSCARRASTSWSTMSNRIPSGSSPAVDGGVLLMKRLTGATRATARVACSIR